MKRRFLVLPAAFAVMAAITTSAGATADDGPVGEPPIANTQELSADGRYVVVLEEEPLVTQFGPDGVNSSAAERKGEEMKADQDEVARNAGVDTNEITYSYTYALNGFSVELNETQLSKMRDTNGVNMIVPDTVRYKQTDSTGDFLGLTRGAWSSGLRGDGVIVGVIDSGIWPEHPSFADDGSFPDPGLALDESVYSACDFGNTAHNPDDVPFTCNNKLLGARQVMPTYRAVIGAAPEEFDSARDDDGHGTHTASTAAGNSGVQATVLGNNIGEISGVAPRAHVIAYKGLGPLGGFGSDLAASIDQAVADGVDVINYSIGSPSAAIGPDDLAFLFAADAGVHVATSAGNSGSDPATIGSPAAVPWLMTVGASTQKRFFFGTVRLGDGERHFGASLTGTLGDTPLVDAEFAGLDGVNAELCLPDTLDPAVVEGTIVLCKRGAIGRAAKGKSVFDAGGAGMVLYNASDVDSLFTDSHFVPAVHIDLTPGLAIKEYIASASDPSAAIVGTGRKTKLPDTVMTIFSSRGPNPLNADIIKPDITGPGLQIVAGYSPASIGGIQGEQFAAISGTSMSSPHIAGLMALMDQQHPDWSPAAVKSALMTTARQDVLDNDRSSAADPFDMGAGHVKIGFPSRSGSAFNPGLVYETGLLDYFGYLCDTLPSLFADPAATCGGLEAAGIGIEAYDLNYPSIGVSELAGTQVVTRTVTNVGTEASKFRVQIDAPAGYEVEVNPSVLKLEAGEAATYQARITNVDAPVGEWRHGSLTWSGAGARARSPISVRGVSYAAPAVVEGSGEAGSASIPVRFGYSGAYTAAGHGLEPATVFSDNVLQDPDQTFDPADVAAGGAKVHEVEASGSALLRIAMPPEATEADADLDIYVIGPAGETVATSTAGGTDELIELVLPGDGTYSIYVHGWASPGGDSDYDLFTWLISATPGGNLVIDGAPASASNGVTSPVDVSWTGATAGEWHLGAVSHSNADGLMGLTLVEVDNR